MNFTSIEGLKTNEISIILKIMFSADFHLKIEFYLYKRMITFKILVSAYY